MYSGVRTASNFGACEPDLAKDAGTSGKLGRAAVFRPIQILHLGSRKRMKRAASVMIPADPVGPGFFFSRLRFFSLSPFTLDIDVHT